MSEKKETTFLGGAAVLAAGTILVKIISAIYKIPIVNILGGSYADFQNAYYIYALLLTVSTAGLPVALSKMVAQAKANGHDQTKKIFRVSFCIFSVLGFLSFLIMFFGAEKLAVLLNDSLAEKSIRALSPAVLCVGCLSAFRGYAQGHSNMTPTTVSQIIESLCKLVVGVIFALFAIKIGKSGDFAAAMAIAGVSVGSVAALIYMIAEYSSHNYDCSCKNKSSISTYSIIYKLISVAIPITLTSSAVSIINLIDTSLVQGRLQSELDITLEQSRELFSAYSGVMTLYNLPASLVIALTISIIPAVSMNLAASDERGAWRVVRTSFHMTALFIFPMGIGLTVLSEPIVKFLFRRLDSGVSGPLLAILGIAAIFVCITSVANAILQAYGYERLPVFIMIAGGIIKILINYNLVAIPAVNINGAPIGTLCCFMFTACAGMFAIRKVVPRPVRYINLFRGPLVAAGLMAASACLIYKILSAFAGNTFAVLVTVIVSVFVYFFLVFFLQLMTKDELDFLLRYKIIAKILKRFS